MATQRYKADVSRKTRKASRQKQEGEKRKLKNTRIYRRGERRIGTTGAL
jgi:hypothetical protein